LRLAEPTAENCVVSAFPDLRPYLDPERVLFLPGSPDKRQALLTIGERLCRHPAVPDHAAYIKAIFDREYVTSTGIGGGVAVPHAQLPGITDFVLALGLCPDGIDFAAKDSKPVRVVVMIAAPTDDRPAYLKTLAGVASRLNRPSSLLAMLAARDGTEAIAAFLS
jgi:mannitol/fructose-specific phosphotransferase system IIA component (Ntr-type)